MPPQCGARAWLQCIKNTRLADRNVDCNFESRWSNDISTKRNSKSLTKKIIGFLVSLRIQLKPKFEPCAKPNPCYSIVLNQKAKMVMKTWTTSFLYFFGGVSAKVFSPLFYFDPNTNTLTNLPQSIANNCKTKES